MKRWKQQSKNMEKLSGVKVKDQQVVKVWRHPGGIIDGRTARSAADDWEKGFSGFLLKLGHDLSGHKTPRLDFWSLF